MPASFLEWRGGPQLWKSLGTLPRQSSAAAAIASGFITDAGPQFWKKKTLNSGNVTLPIKTTVSEGFRILFGHRDRDTGTAMF